MMPIVWVGGSRRDLSVMPEAVRKDFGGALHAAQLRFRPEGTKPLKGTCQGALQLSDDHDGETYRAVYTVELEGVLYVLHCFHKKSKSGIATPKADLELIERRLKAARRRHEEQRNDDRKRS